MITFTLEVWLENILKTIKKTLKPIFQLKKGAVAFTKSQFESLNGYSNMIHSAIQSGSLKPYINFFYEIWKSIYQKIQII